MAEFGVGGADPFSVSMGTRFERTRMGGRCGGPADIALAVAGRAGGGGGGVAPEGSPPSDLPGDAVCARGGGGRGVGFGSSDAAWIGHVRR